MRRGDRTFIGTPGSGVFKLRISGLTLSGSGNYFLRISGRRDSNFLMSGFKIYSNWGPRDIVFLSLGFRVFTLRFRE